MKVQIVSRSFCIIALISILFSCSTTIPPIEGYMAAYLIEEETNTLEKEKIRISIKPINETDMSYYPELFLFDPSPWENPYGNSSTFYFPPDSSGNCFAYTFSGMPAFFTSIENSTAHILRMKDARVYLIIEGEDPIPAIDKFGSRNFVETELNIRGKPEIETITESALKYDESLLDYITRIEMQTIKKLTSDPALCLQLQLRLFGSA